jgi:hypothetical protein
VYHGLATTLSESPGSLTDDIIARLVRLFTQIIGESLAPTDTLRILGVALSQSAGADARVQRALESLDNTQQSVVQPYM